MVVVVVVFFFFFVGPAASAERPKGVVHSFPQNPFLPMRFFFLFFFFWLVFVPMALTTLNTGPVEMPKNIKRFFFFFFFCAFAIHAQLHKTRLVFRWNIPVGLIENQFVLPNLECLFASKENVDRRKCVNTGNVSSYFVQQITFRFPEGEPEPANIWIVSFLCIYKDFNIRIIPRIWICYLADFVGLVTKRTTTNAARPVLPVIIHAHGESRSGELSCTGLWATKLHTCKPSRMISGLSKLHECYTDFLIFKKQSCNLVLWHFIETKKETF